MQAPDGRSASGTVTADGETVHVRTDEPARFIRALGSNNRARTAAVGDLVSASGVTVEVSGPDGLIARFGSGVDSRLGRLLTGSPAVDVRGAVVSTWRTQGARIGAAAAGLAAVLVLVGRVRRRRG